MPSAPSAPMAAIVPLGAVWPGTAGPATNRAHALSGSSGERDLESPGMLRQAASARPATDPGAGTPRTHSPVAGPTPSARDPRLSRDRGPLASRCSGGMCDSSVGYRPRPPRGPGRPATTSPPPMTRTARPVTPTPTVRPTGASGTGWRMWPTRTWQSGATLGRRQPQTSWRDGGGRCGSPSSGRSSRGAPQPGISRALGQPTPSPRQSLSSPRPREHGPCEGAIARRPAMSTVPSARPLSLGLLTRAGRIPRPWCPARRP